MIGCGTVGGGVLELLARQAGAMAERYGVRFRVTQIAVRDLAKPRGALAAGIPLTTRALELVADPEVDVIVEVAGGLEVEPVLTAALAAGKPVVTANKALLAQEARRARRARAAHRDPAAVRGRGGGGAADHPPPLASRRRGRQLDGDRQRHLQLHHHADRAGRAVARRARSWRRRRSGSPRPIRRRTSLGHDAAAKLSILAYRAFGAWVPPDALSVRGIGELRPRRLRSRRGDGVPDPPDRPRGAQPGRRARRRRSSRCCSRTGTCSRPSRRSTTRSTCKCASSGDLSLFGKGAGALPTATAVLGDLIDLAQDNSVQWPEPRRVTPAPAPARRHYLRVTGGGRTPACRAGSTASSAARA